MHMGCGRAHRDRTPPISDGDLRQIYCGKRVIDTHGKLQLAYFVVAWEVVERHDLHRRDASTPFGGRSRKLWPTLVRRWVPAGLGRLSSLQKRPQYDHCWPGAGFT